MAKPLSMIKLLVQLPLIFLLVPCLCCPAYQKQFLLHFKSSLLTSYDTSNSSVFGLESWDSISDCCKWTRVVCSSHSRDITALYLGDLYIHNEYNAVNVQILDPIYGIRSLRFLNVSNTYIQGEISGEGLANLTKLIHLDMSRNLLNGSIPPQLFQLWFLQSLDLSDNSLKDGLSREIGKLENLRSLKLDRNSIDGNIPVQIGNLTRLQQFSVSQNKFLGPIPESILNLKGLEILDVSYNHLEMPIPDWIGTLFHISILKLSGNSFTGLIPPSIRNLSKLETLELEDNMLSGEIPSWLFDIESLKNLYLGGNKFIWNNNVKIVPKCMLSQLSLRSCKISADIPEWISAVAFDFLARALLMLSCLSETIPSSLQILLADQLRHLKLVGLWLGVMGLHF
nr:PREDICTED: leucine-rich repeat receptor protein kinase EMS1-like [Daucus carota subsp. sativus]